MAKVITILLSLLAITINVQSQFYDFFQNYQPFLPIHQTTRRPDFSFYSQEDQKKSKGEATITNDRHTSKEQGRKPLERESNRQTTKKKHTTTASIFTFNFFTTPKPKKVNKSTNRRHFDTNANPTGNARTGNTHSGLLYGSDKYLDETLNNIASDYHTTTKRSYTTTRPRTTKQSYTASRQSYTTPKPAIQSYTTSRPSFTAARPSYTTSRPSYNVRPSNTIRPPSAFYNENNPNYNSNFHTTLKPGVKPANVDLSKPPITNKPPTKLAVYPKPTDSSVIRFPEDPDSSPDVITGPDEDGMSYVEKRRYIEMAEKMCDKYKALSVKRVEAIPLVPTPEPVRLNVSVCPKSSVPLVVGGKVVTIQEYPHMALLGWTKLQGGGYSWKCGGSLISDQYVLTASHCAYQDKDDTVVTGAPRVVQLGSSYLDDTGALVMRVSSVIRHPKYRQNRSYYDVALIKLVKPVTFSEVVKPACLGNPPGVGEPIIASGWGRTENGGSQSLELRSVSIPVWDIEECHRVLGTSRKLPNGPSADSQICAGEKKGGKDTCQGDSGGPAQIQDGCAWRVVAVTSVGRSCGAPNTPALYATLHIPFIAAQIFGKNGQTDRPTNSNNNRDTVNVNSNNDNNRQTYTGINHNNNRDTNYNNGNNYSNNNRETVNVNSNNDNNRQAYSGTNHNNNRDTSYNNGNNYSNNNNRDTINVNSDNDNSNIYYSSPNNNDRQTNSGTNHNNNRDSSYNNGNNYYNNNNDRVTNNYNNQNHGNTQYYSSRPITNLDNNNRQDYNYNAQNYNSNYNNNAYNNGNIDNGYSNSNFGNNYYVQPSYTVTEAPRYNNDRSWWQPY